MPTIRFLKNLPPIQAEAGEPLMQCLLRAGLPVASSCQGDGVCGKCRVQIVEGLANLSPVQALEEMLIERYKIPSSMRISCQAKVLGDITVDTSYW